MKKLLSLMMVFSFPFTFAHQVLAEEKTIEIMAPMLASGEVFDIAPKQMLIQASLTGVVYVTDEQNPLNGLVVRCPGLDNIDLTSKVAKSQGHCTFTNDDPQDIIYAKWECTGRLGSCQGNFTLTGGSGKFQGISGKSDLMVRSSLVEVLGRLPSGTAVTDVVGLIVWRNFTYRLP